jgi:hypothetical protein
MSSPQANSAPNAVAGTTPQKVRPRGPWRSGTAKAREPVSREAQRMAAAILEVLAGVRTPAGAASALGITVPRYYVWEQRAVAGLVAACEPQSPGGTSPRWQIAMLEKEVERLKQQCARQEALTRAAQRTLGLAPLPVASRATKDARVAQSKAGHKPGDKRSRPRRPVVRALKAAAGLRATPPAEEGASSSGAVSPEVLQPGPPSTPASSAAAVAADRGG